MWISTSENKYLKNLGGDLACFEDFGSRWKASLIQTHEMASMDSPQHLISHASRNSSCHADSKIIVNLKAIVRHNPGSSTDRFSHRSLHAMRRGCKKVTKFGLVFKNSNVEWLFVCMIKIWREGVSKFEPRACEDENRQQDMEL